MCGLEDFFVFGGLTRGSVENDGDESFGRCSREYSWQICALNVELSVDLCQKWGLKVCDLKQPD